MNREFWKIVVDCLEGDTAVLALDDNVKFNLPVEYLPADARRRPSESGHCTGNRESESRKDRAGRLLEEFKET
jgi:hypothetical protein